MARLEPSHSALAIGLIAHCFFRVVLLDNFKKSLTTLVVRVSSEETLALKNAGSSVVLHVIEQSSFFSFLRK